MSCTKVRKILLFINKWVIFLRTLLSLYPFICAPLCPCALLSLSPCLSASSLLCAFDLATICPSAPAYLLPFFLVPLCLSAPFLWLQLALATLYPYEYLTLHPITLLCPFIPLPLYLVTSISPCPCTPCPFAFYPCDQQIFLSQFLKKGADRTCQREKKYHWQMCWKMYWDVSARKKLSKIPISNNVFRRF